MANRSFEASSRLFERMARVMPAGSTRTTTFYLPYPVAIERGDGYRLWDIDGNEYIDLLGNYSALVHGQAAPSIVAAVDRAMRNGSAHPAPLVVQAELAERICARIPSVEKVRFTNSGNEAVMVAVRAARAITGRDCLVKAIGGYHGSWEQVALGASEFEPRPGEEADSEPGVPARVGEMLCSVRYNDVAHLEATMAEHGANLVYSLFLDVFGAGLLVGLVVMAAKRGSRPARLDYGRVDAVSSTFPRERYAAGDWIFVGSLLFLGVTGFLLESLRIAQTDPSFETWSPLGWVVGQRPPRRRPSRRCGRHGALRRVVGARGHGARFRIRDPIHQSGAHAGRAGCRCDARRARGETLRPAARRTGR